MRLILCDCCGESIENGPTNKSGVYQFGIRNMSDVHGVVLGADYPKIEPIDLCYYCAMDAGKSVAKWLRGNMGRGPRARG